MWRPLRSECWCRHIRQGVRGVLSAGALGRPHVGDFGLERFGLLSLGDDARSADDGVEDEANEEQETSQPDEELGAALTASAGAQNDNDRHDGCDHGGRDGCDLKVRQIFVRVLDEPARVEGEGRRGVFHG